MFNKVLDDMNVFEHEDFPGERRLKGFLFLYTCGKVRLEGRIPWAVAKEIHQTEDIRVGEGVEGLNNDPLCWLRHPQSKQIDKQCHYDESLYAKEMKRLIEQGDGDKMFVTYYQITSEAGLRHVVDVIRKCGLYNEWAIGNE